MMKVSEWIIINTKRDGEDFFSIFLSDKNLFKGKLFKWRSTVIHSYKECAH